MGTDSASDSPRGQSWLSRFFLAAVLLAAFRPALALPAFDNDSAKAADSNSSQFNDLSTVLTGQNYISVHARVRDSEVGISSAALPFSPDGATVALWHFDDVQGSTLTEAMNDYPGTILNSPSRVTTQLGTGFSFTGSQAVQLKWPPIRARDNYTIETWVKHGSNPSGSQTIYDEAFYYSDNGTWTDGISLKLVNGSPVFCTYALYGCATVSDPVPGNPMFADGNWHHLAAVFSSDQSDIISSATIFLDGRAVGSLTQFADFGYLAADQYAAIGCQAQGASGNGSCQGYMQTGWSSGYQYGLNASLDEMRILDYAATPAQIQADYLQGRVPFAGYYTWNGGDYWWPMGPSSMASISWAAEGDSRDYYTLTASGIQAAQHAPAGTNKVEFIVVNATGAASYAVYDLAVSSLVLTGLTLSPAAAAAAAGQSQRYTASGNFNDGITRPLSVLAAPASPGWKALNPLPYYRSFLQFASASTWLWAIGGTGYDMTDDSDHAESMIYVPSGNYWTTAIGWNLTAPSQGTGSAGRYEGSAVG